MEMRAAEINEDNLRLVNYLTEVCDAMSITEPFSSRMIYLTVW